MLIDRREDLGQWHKILIREKWAERIGLLVFLLGCRDLMRLLPFGLQKQIHQAGAGFKSLTEVIDTTTPTGRMMMQMVGAFAEFERAMLRERTKAGLDAARQEGRIGGRRPKLSPQQQAEIRRMVTRGDKSAADAARLFKVHPATVSRLLARTDQSFRFRMGAPSLASPTGPAKLVTSGHARGT